LDAENRCQKDVDLAGLDFLHGADVQIDEFSQSLLCHRLGIAFPANICPKFSQLSFFFATDGHGALSREPRIRGNGAMGRKILLAPATFAFRSGSMKRIAEEFPNSERAVPLASHRTSRDFLSWIFASGIGVAAKSSWRGQ
jgi:hypothetical protein